MRNNIIKTNYIIVLYIFLAGIPAACEGNGNRSGDVAASPQGAARLAVLLGAGDAGYPKATEPRRFEFPADHGPHPDYRNEWWYRTGNLDDGSELMVYRLRRLDGSPDPYSAGTWVPATGPAVALGPADVEIAVTDRWDSPLGGRYPVAWRLAVPRLGLVVGITPVMKNQELTTRVRYWEGAVDVDGTRAGTAVSGRGYVELTGYAR